MSAADPAMLRAIADARALLAAFMAGDWRELRVDDDDGSIFLAQPGGAANPLLQAAAAAAPKPAVGSTLVTAPHVATFVSAPAPGTRVQVGEEVAVISVLDEEEAVLAVVSGKVASVPVTPGDLLAFGQPILVLTQTQP